MLCSTILRTGEYRLLLAPILPLHTCDVSRVQQIRPVLPSLHIFQFSRRRTSIPLRVDFRNFSICGLILHRFVDPKPGYAGSKFSVHVYNRAHQTTVQVEVESIAHNYYVFQVVWFDTTTLLLRLMNREQTAEDIAFCDGASGSCRLAVTSIAPRGWLEQSAILPVPERNAFLQV